ncbi:MAG: hypothetical protein AAFZ63_07925 [Bacteroidota bacterium]
MKSTPDLFPQAWFLLFTLLIAACNITEDVTKVPPAQTTPQIPADKMGGGSSGMVQITDSTYLLAYDLKIFQKGPRLAILTASDEAIRVSPIVVDSWGEDGLASDLESVCAIPGRPNEFLASESGNWQGELGRIFHLKLNPANHQAQVLGSSLIPMLQRNDFDITGDQYEAIYCLPSSETQRLVLLGERGGSPANPQGVMRWGLLDLEQHSFTFTDAGLTGLSVNAPGHWQDEQTKRSITDIHVDAQGTIWASASEDQGDAGPFYSVIYRLGQLRNDQPSLPLTIAEELTEFKEIDGFKLEALAGPRAGIQCTHSFGTEDEIYGGIWRPIQIDFKE